MLKRALDRSDHELLKFDGHIFLSPHPDDSVLSCGGSIQRCISLGLDTRVITIFTGSTLGKLSSFADKLLTNWGCRDPVHAAAVRMKEDSDAFAVLGVKQSKLVYLNHLDAIYRAYRGKILYANAKQLFANIHSKDKALISYLTHQLDTIIPAHRKIAIYAPLGIGGHVDHQITHLAARALNNRRRKVCFYDDIPYAMLSKVDQAQAMPGKKFKLIHFQLADFNRKVKAIKKHVSQFKQSVQQINMAYNKYYERFEQSVQVERFWL